MVTLQSIQGHTGLTHPSIFDIERQSAGVSKNLKRGLEQYGLEHLVDSFLPQSEKVWD